MELLGTLEVYVNGKYRKVVNPDPIRPLISYLREIGLTGTKLGCSEGGCGSCTVLVSHQDPHTNSLIHLTRNACLTPLASVHLKHVITIEGLGSVQNPHPIQKQFAEKHGSQCGFCTPGIVMSFYGLLKSNAAVAEEDIEESFDGNLCRCTGYRPILEGAKTFINKKSCSKSCSVNGLCSDESIECDNLDMEDIAKARNIQPHPMISAFENNEKLSFPNELLHKRIDKSYYFSNGKTQWYHPNTVDEVLEIMANFPNSKIVNGNTEIGIEVRFKAAEYPTFISASHIKELKSFVITSKGVRFGAFITLTNFQSELKKLVHTLPSHQTRGFRSLLDNLQYFAGSQIRNVAVIGGNIITASPISDLNPVFVAMGAIVCVASKENKVREIVMNDFFVGYRKTALKKGEILLSIFVPFTEKYEYIKAYKQSKRKDDDIAIVNAGIRIKFDKRGDGWAMQDVGMAFGGMGATTIRPSKTIQQLKGKLWTSSIVNEAANLLNADMPMSISTPGGQAEYRRTLTTSFFEKFSLHVNSELSSVDSEIVRPLSERDTSVLTEIERDVSVGYQSFEEAPSTEIVGRPTMHASAVKQVTGEAIYVDDMPKFANELYAVLVTSTEAHANILFVDTKEALGIDGVVDYVSYMDIPKYREGMKENDEGNPNMIGPIFVDEELFATKKVYHHGQMLGIIIAENETVARRASRKVKVTYEKLPAIFTIEEAIAKESFFSTTRALNWGEFSAVADIKHPDRHLPVTDATNFVEGECRMSAQEHFYLETNACIAVPKREDNEMEMFVSTQHPSEVQHFIAHILGILSNKVTVRVKRMGGGFGGKETRALFLSAAAAVAARKHGVPIRAVLSREEDMAITGMRHPFLGKYKVGFTGDGILVSLECEIFNNAGYSVDLSKSVLERAMTHADNCYKIPNVKIIGKMCKTNIATNTAFRGFGGPQGLMIAETYITHVAEALKMPVEEVRSKNFYRVNDITPFNQVMEDFHIERCWHELLSTSDFSLRKAQVKEYNSKNKYRKRGIVCMPTKFGLSFTARFLNQAGALVHIYVDGSVLVSHGGTEMGQGLHTKMLQVTAQALGISIDKVHISETNTNMVANTSATAASVSSDLNGMAIFNACLQLNDRLKSYKIKDPEITWEELIKAAYFDRVNLSANGFYATPDLDYNMDTNTGRLYNYFTYGCACTEVEIDVLTGDHSVLRSDIVMDIGKSINPSIDIGQIEGGFVQGQGWCTIEEPLISPHTGALLTRGPGAYKIPGFRDIPVDFRIRILKGARNVRAIHSSKAVGEPPLFLGASVYFALREAIKSARLDNGIEGYFKLDSPATSERIRMSCLDYHVKAAKMETKENEKPWSIRA